MELFCPDSSCENHRPTPLTRWFDYHGSYESCNRIWQRYRCRGCGRTFSERTLSIDYWTHKHIDYESIIEHVAGGFSVRALSRHFAVSVKTIQNRIGRLSRTIIPTLSTLQQTVKLNEDLVADGLENFCVSQDFPNNIHLLVGKDSQYTYGLNYALMRRKGTKTKEQRLRCQRLYPKVDFTTHTIKKTFAELIEQMKRVATDRAQLKLFTDERAQYVYALQEDRQIHTRTANGSFEHIRISSQLPRTVLNPLFSVNYLDREIRKDLPEYHRETVCFGRNVSNALERLCVYLYHHNFLKSYRIDRGVDELSHAEVAGIGVEEIARIRKEVVTKRRFIKDGEVVSGGFFDALWRRVIPTPLKQGPEYLQKFALA